LSWSVPNGGALSYNVYRNAALLVSGVTLLGYTDSTVSANTAYMYYVTAVNALGEGRPSNTVTPTTLPNAPQSLAAGTPTTTTVPLSWGAPVGGASNYNIYQNGVRVQSGIVGLSTTVTGLSPSTTYSFYVRAVGTGGEGSQSNTVNATTAAAGNSIVWAPGHYARTGTNGNRTTPSSGGLSQTLARMDQVIAQDINNKFEGFCFPFYWTALENPNGPATSPASARYDGSWDASGNSGFAIVQALINKAKSYSPPRSIMLTLNCAGNGVSNDTNPAFPSFFAPSYLNSSTYAGGAEWGGSISGYPGVQIKYWNNNVQARIVDMVSAYYAHFGPDTATSGIYLFDPFNEISAPTLGTFSNEELITSMTNTLLPGPASGLRGAAPRWMFWIRPTFLKGNTANSQYQPLFNLMQTSYIACGEEDSCQHDLVPGATLTTAQQNVHQSWGTQAYRGISTFNGGGNLGWPNHVALGDWTFICNVENAEMGWTSNSVAVPPAVQGSGYFQDSPQYPGVMTGVKQLLASHVVWFIDSDTAGPNCNRGPAFTSGSAPANPVGGPAPGSTATRPDNVDVITGNTSYAGVTGMPIPNTTKPPSWP